MNSRLIFLVIVMFSIFSIVCLRIYSLQINKGELYKVLAEGANLNFQFQNERGEILFRNGEKLATNISAPCLIVESKKLINNKEAVKKLEEVLNLPESEILEKLTNSSFVILKRKLTKEEVEKIKELKIPGIVLTQQKIRYYPYGKLAANVVGFVNSDGEGQYGLEEFYEPILKEGKNIQLTLDFNIQKKAEAILEKAKEFLDIEGGQIIVMDPFSGEIYALANYPGFDPNNFESENIELFKNGATQKLFEPGSIFKPLTMAAAIEEGKITPETKYVDEGFVKIGGWTITNFENKVWGERTMTEVLAWSINTGAVFAERKLGHDLFLKYLEKFGIFEKTGIDLPEIYSKNKELKKGYEVNFATAAFGQGVEVTPIQAVRALAVIANGGYKIEPHLLLNKEIKKERIISKTTAETVTKMLIEAVEYGYGKRAKIDKYYIAGKTGTSQMPFASLGIEQKGYSDKTWQSFVSWFPAFNPRFLILIKLDNPKAISAGVSTTGLARELIEYLLTFYQIPPDYE